MTALHGATIITNDIVPTGRMIAGPSGRVFMSRLTYGHLATALAAPDGATPVLRLSFREWRRWKLNR